MGITNSTTDKPERLTLNNLAGGSYSLVIINFGAQSDTGNYEVGLLR